MTAQTDLESTEGLRFLLLRLAYSGPRAWQDEAEATELVDFLTTKYGALARKYGLEPADAAAAAFDVMRTRSARVADDTWAVITRAVQLTLIYEARAQGLLCSNQAARRPELADCHDAERFSDRERALAEFHPAFHVHDTETGLDGDDDGAEESTNSFVALDRAVELFAENGWPSAAARMALEYVCSQLSSCGDRHHAYEYLRRDVKGRNQLDLDQRSWIRLLRVVLGDPRRDFAGTRMGRGILLRLCLGEELTELCCDDEVTAIIWDSSPTATGDAHV